jgi:hypothetical protein
MSTPASRPRGSGRSRPPRTAGEEERGHAAAGSGDGSRCRRRGCSRRRAVLGGPGGRGHLEPPGRKRGTTPPPSPRAARTSGGHLRRRRGAMVAATTRFFASRYNKVILEMDSLPLLHMLQSDQGQRSNMYLAFGGRSENLTGRGSLDFRLSFGYREGNEATHIRASLVSESSQCYLG